jgi:hypothetical protein
MKKITIWSIILISIISLVTLLFFFKTDISLSPLYGSGSGGSGSGTLIYSGSGSIPSAVGCVKDSDCNNPCKNCVNYQCVQNDTIPECQSCCLCEYLTQVAQYDAQGNIIYKNLMVQEILAFYDECKIFVNRDVCKTKIIRPFDIKNASKCNIPTECKNRSLQYMYAGHGDSVFAEGFISRTARICIDCPYVEAAISACNIFEDSVAAQNYLNNLKLPDNIT